MVLYAQQLELARGVGHQRGEAIALCNWGVASMRLGDVQKAFESYDKALEISRRTGDLRGEGIGIVLTNLAQLLAIRNDVATAITHSEAALKIFEQLGDPKASQVRTALEVWREEISAK